MSFNINITISPLTAMADATPFLLLLALWIVLLVTRRRLLP